MFKLIKRYYEIHNREKKNIIECILSEMFFLKLCITNTLVHEYMVLFPQLCGFDNNADICIYDQSLISIINNQQI